MIKVLAFFSKWMIIVAGKSKKYKGTRLLDKNLLSCDNSCHSWITAFEKVRVISFFFLRLSLLTYANLVPVSSLLPQFEAPGFKPSFQWML
jgi:hypothetical protein